MEDNILIFLEAFGIGFGSGLFVGLICVIFSTIIKLIFSIMKGR